MDLHVLTNEFEAGDGSFLITIRPNMIWDIEAFDRLTDAMEQYCRVHGGSQTLERWVAQGFWYVPGFICNWTSHPNFPRAFPTTYYETAYRRLDDLAYWYFCGHSGHAEDL
ncbi:hypothetical protein [Mesorhizobium sp.]|uniref:hypothetical protein n=1 Tax=Mesorhizobium sp. TaxID=1871066 RepID=UPI0025FBB16D|nr:hypothetical protein [Mesorhizobium sp.]